MVELREIFGRRDDGPPPDLAMFARNRHAQEIPELMSPLGTFFDVFPFHLLTTASLAELTRINPAANFDVRRFRPNFLIRSNDRVRGFEETKWAGRTLRIGEVRIKIEMPAVRCVMPTLDQKTLPKDPSVLRTIVKHAAQNVGLYATVSHSGRIQTGEEVTLE